MKSVVGVITARGGSKGLPGKNIRSFAGKPLIAWTIEAAQHSESLLKTIVSTDDEEIAKIARDCGAEVPFIRPRELAEDNSAHIDVVLHCLDWIEQQGDSPDYLMLLQPTSPLRNAQDIRKVVQMVEHRDPEAILAVNETHDHPYLTRTIDENGSIRPLIEMPEIHYPRRQDLPPAYFINGSIYLNSVASLRKTRSFYPADALGYVMPSSRSVQIDTLLDFVAAEAIANAGIDT